MKYEPVIGLEVHAELQTRSKMFCACPVVDSTRAEPNSAVCPVCAGMPGALPVVNRAAVEHALRVALALDCEVAQTSLFARKNYFYPDLPKGYQISQYEYPLAQHGRLIIDTPEGEYSVRVRRVHLEEDTGKLIHLQPENGEPCSLVDLNRAGVALLEIVSEPDLRTLEQARAYAEGLRAVLRRVGANSGDMEKGVIRFEANVSLRPAGSPVLGTRVEIKNLNSFRAMERAIAYEVQRQAALLERGEAVRQQTLGWDEVNEVTLAQRSKEEAHDYRYFPEPDLPPLVIDEAWIQRARASLPELPRALKNRLHRQYNLPQVEAALLAADAALAAYFEQAAAAAGGVAPPRAIAAWITGEMFAFMNQSGQTIADLLVSPQSLADLLRLLADGTINPNTAKLVLAEMLASGNPAAQIVAERNLCQVSDGGLIAEIVARVLAENPVEAQAYRQGKTSLFNWLLGQVMRQTGGRASPPAARAELERQLAGSGQG
ncbi:MAG: Asp-tRNA(Asn)/Glu-tRNA(Gln) amidotransferase subunit GatB [Chloroflexota bacterium]